MKRQKKKLKEGEIKGRGQTILVVEDEPAILNLCKIMLEEKGYKVLTSEKPYEAIEIAKKHKGKIDLLITDVIMPDMDGKELEKNIKKYHPKIKSLFMSGYTANVISHHRILYQGINFIQKPFNSVELAKKVKEILSKEAK